ncbi:MAG: hypothetical protein ACRDGL_05200 [Candidatus Limnocylindrales bacterium]
MIQPTPTPRTPRRPEAHLEPSHAWILGLALADDGTVVAAPDVRADDGAWPALGDSPDWAIEASAFGPCSCPEPCARDHGND